VWHDRGMSTSAQPEPTLVDVEPIPTAVIRGVVGMDEIAAFFDSAFSRLAPALAGQGVAIVGPAFALYHGAPGAVADLEVGFPTASTIETDGDAVASRLPGGRVARLVHEGSFDHLGSSWGRLAEWIAAAGLTPGEDLWEVYLTEPSPEMNPADLRTELNWPVTG
jgi:effector-binding domain-containing protein